MVTTPTRDESKEPHRGGQASTGPATAPPTPKRKARTMNLVELRPGLFLNTDHVVSLRVLPREENSVYAILQLSNGDQQNLTRDELATIIGEEPR